MTGKDDAAWFRFEAFETQTVFIGMAPKDAEAGISLAGRQPHHSELRLKQEA